MSKPMIVVTGRSLRSLKIFYDEMSKFFKLGKSYTYDMYLTLDRSKTSPEDLIVMSQYQDIAATIKSYENEYDLKMGEMPENIYKSKYFIFSENSKETDS